MPSPLCAMLVTVAANASAPERAAAGQLSAMVGKMCGRPPGAAIAGVLAAQGKAQLAVGVGAATAVGITPADLSYANLGADGFVSQSRCDLSYLADLLIREFPPALTCLVCDSINRSRAPTAPQC